MITKSKLLMLFGAIALGIVVMLLPRPEGTKYEILGDPGQKVLAAMGELFTLDGQPDKEGKYIILAKEPGAETSTGAAIEAKVKELGLQGVEVAYVDGLSPKAKTFLAVLTFLIVMFVAEPVPLEITAMCIGVLLIATGVSSVKDAWAAYMNPVVVFIMCCLIFAIALDKAQVTKRLAHAVAKRAGDSVVKFTFILAISLGLASSVMHDAAAAAIGFATILPLMRAAGIEPNTNTSRFMMLSIPFAASAGGMGTLVGGGRCMVSAAFLKELTGMELTFLDWMLYAGPGALLCVPAVVGVLYLVFRPDTKIKLPKYDDEIGKWTRDEIITLSIFLLVLLSWLTKGITGLDYSVTGIAGVVLLVLTGVLKWHDIHTDLEWGTALFIFGGGLALGLAMDSSGAARYFANLVFPLVKGGGWLLLLASVGIFGALVTNAMANVAAAALILPIVIPLAKMEGVDPRILALGLGMCTSFAYLLVIGCPPNAIAYSFKQFRAIDLTKAGLVATPIMLALVLGVAAVWWHIMGLV